MVGRAWVGLLLAGGFGCSTEIERVWVEVPPRPETEPAPVPSCEAGRWAVGWANESPDASRTLWLSGLDVGDDCTTAAGIYMRDPPAGWTDASQLMALAPTGQVRWSVPSFEAHGVSNLAPVAVPGGQWWVVERQSEPHWHQFVRRRDTGGGERYGFALGNTGGRLQARPIRRGQLLLYGQFDEPAVIGGKVMVPVGESSAFVARIDRAGHRQWAYQLDGAHWMDVRGDRFGGAAALIDASEGGMLGGQAIPEGVALAEIDPWGEIRLSPLPDAIKSTYLFLDVQGRLVLSGAVDGTAALFGTELSGVEPTGFVAVRARDGELAWSTTLPGAVEVQVTADELGHVYLLVRRADAPLSIGEQTFDQTSRVLAHFDEDGTLLATRSLDLPVSAGIEFVAAPAGGVLLGGRYNAPFVLHGATLDTVGAGLFLASFSPDLQ